MKKLCTYLILILFGTSLYASESTSTAELEKIKKKYNIINENSCRVAINTVLPSNESENLEIACFILGQKNILYTGRGNQDTDFNFSFEKFLHNSDPNLAIDPDLVSILEKRKDIRFFIVKVPGFEDKIFNQIYMYTPEQEFNALKLAIDDLSLKGLWYNHYLTGTLLGYKEDDKAFFYALEGFIEYAGLAPIYSEEGEFIGLGEKGLNRINFSNWPQQRKEEFNKWEKEQWPKTPAYAKFQEDVKKAHAWLASYVNKTAAQLKQELKVKLQKFIRNRIGEINEQIKSLSPEQNADEINALIKERDVAQQLLTQEIQ
jgi:hypothetical protein